MANNTDENNRISIVEVSAENTFRMLDYYQNEWMYRHKHFWNLLTKLFVLNLFIAVLPFMSNAFNIKFENLEILKFIFPMAAIVITSVSAYALFIEANRMSAVGAKKYEINKYMDKLYQYKSNNDHSKKNFKIYTVTFISMMTLVIIEVLSLIIVIVNQ